MNNDINKLTESFSITPGFKVSIMNAIDNFREPFTDHNIMEIFEELTFREKWKKVFHGLKEPEESGDYKWAHLQIIRLLSPVSAVVVPCMIVALFLFMPQQKEDIVSGPTILIEKQKPEELDPIDPIKEEVIEPPKIKFETIHTVTDQPEVTKETRDVRFSAVPVPKEAFQLAISPKKFAGLFVGRPGSPGSPQGDGGPIGSPGSESAVYRALRWLKKNQNDDGSWSGNCGGGTAKFPEAKSAYTSLALLTFLAHGEKPEYPEFGHTVETAMRWLIKNQNDDGRYSASDKHEYSLPIAGYALAEAYTMIRNPDLKQAAIKTIDLIIKGQHESGGWNYNLNAEDRDDTSYMGWCAQALKAAYIAGLPNDGLEQAMKKAITGFRKNQGKQGGFGYTSAGQGGLSGAGVLCLQMLGAGDSPDVQRGLAYLKSATCDWAKPMGHRPLYYWYYITQAKFHAGGDDWAAWEKQFAPTLINSQVQLENAIADPEGRMVDIGYWDSPAEKETEDSRVLNTCLSTLMLEVYYRYLPSYRLDEIDDTDIADNIIEIEDIKLDIEYNSASNTVALLK